MSSFSSTPTRANANTNTTALRFLSTMRQPFGYSPVPKKRPKDVSKSGMYSTPEERTPHEPSLSSHFRSADSSATPPTVEQIAMGLHISRTPHLRPISKQHYRRNSAPGSPFPNHPYENSRRAASPRVLPPAPSRSSLKKTSPLASTSTITPTTVPGLSISSTSSTIVASATLSATPQGYRSVVSLKSRMSRFLTGSRHLPLSPRSPTLSPADSAVDLPSRKKSVRFTSTVLGPNETVRE